ncbi:thiamine pyrophosphate-dependent enzyme [Providencia sp. PROV273]|uniref:thiamine pyrophosphate-dependent enzyme n=1 Tax=Providencia sp. PROV273 TaxID=2949960 RepID=UPI0023496F8D|nr:thiamine pyrophosphate-dependent enzyme [Providencia sp. PROV273]
MGNAILQALGLKVGFPDRQVIALCGDGGISMLMADILTLIQENIPLKMVIFNNGTLDFVELEQKSEELIRSYTELKNPDFAKLFEVAGIKGFTAKNSHDLESIVEAFLEHDRPAVLDAYIPCVTSYYGQLISLSIM